MIVESISRWNVMEMYASATLVPVFSPLSFHSIFRAIFHEFPLNTIQVFYNKELLKIKGGKYNPQNSFPASIFTSIFPR
jgi:hypothetical protein